MIFENPAPLTEVFEEGLSTALWDFTIINGAGQVSNEATWHAAEMVIDHQLIFRHVQDPKFETESPKWQEPSSGQYNNVTLIGGSGFQPTPSSDVVVEFKSRVDENFYGTAGVILQPAGTLQADGMFALPFDMFGFSVIGRESAVNGINGPICYLALNWIPAEVEAMKVDPELWHTYYRSVCIKSAGSNGWEPCRWTGVFLWGRDFPSSRVAGVSGAGG